MYRLTLITLFLVSSPVFAQTINVDFEDKSLPGPEHCLLWPGFCRRLHQPRCIVQQQLHRLWRWFLRLVGLCLLQRRRCHHVRFYQSIRCLSSS